MKILSKQRNSRMCMICGLDNEYGVNAPFYNMEDGSVMTVFRYKEQHQSYPGRVHGGMITAMLDEMGLRSLWAKGIVGGDFWCERYRWYQIPQTVPYETELIGRGVVVKNTSHFIITDSYIMDKDGEILANGRIKYIKMDTQKIQEGVEVHEEMPYLVEDGRTEIEGPFFDNL